MSQTPRDDTSATHATRAGGLANVFRGLARSRSNRLSPTANLRPSSPLAFAATDASLAAQRLSPGHMDALERLRMGDAAERIAAANTLRSVITEYPLNPVLEVWYAAKDLVNPSQPADVRHAGWELLSECVKHGSPTDLERKEFFQTLSASAHSDDFHLQLAAMSNLTGGGRALNGFDYELIPLLTNWLKRTYKAAQRARKAQPARSRSSTRGRNSVVLVEESNFRSLFSFLINVIKFSFNHADESAICGLLDCLLHVCKTTNMPEDLRSSIALIDAIVTFGTIPSRKLEACVHVLSSIFCLVPSSMKDAWRTLSHLCRSHNGQAIVRLLLDLLRTVTTTRAVDRDRAREIKGALTVVHKLLSKSSEKGYPSMPYALLSEGLANTVEVTTSGTAPVLVLQIIRALFGHGDEPTHPLIVDEDWSALLSVAAKCSLLIETESEAPSRSEASGDQSQNTIGREIRQLIKRLERLVTLKSTDFVPRESIINFFIQVHSILADSTVCVLLDYFQEFRCCSPSDPAWERNVKLVLDSFFRNTNRESTTRLRAFETVMDAYEDGDLTETGYDQDFTTRLVKDIIEDAAEEADPIVLERMLNLMVPVATACDIELFDRILTTTKLILFNAKSTASISPAPSMQQQGASHQHSKVEDHALSMVAIRSLSRLFLRTMNNDHVKATKLFDLLVGISKSKQCETDARLGAMQVLFRLRSNWTHNVSVTTDLDTDYLATVLCRTESSMKKKRADEASHQHRSSRIEHHPTTRPNRGVSFSSSPVPERGIPTRSASGPKPSLSKYQHKWKLPDTNALPEPPTTAASMVLMSFPIATNEGSDQDLSSAKTRNTGFLDVSSWLEAVLGVLRGDDWEIYSFVLTHLPAQLANHTFFASALPQIKTLRKLLCEHIRTNGFQEPPSVSGLWRADVAICLFQSLTMLLSYHEIFQKGDEDEMVRTFVLGITTWERTARSCIHALTICCHELPVSVSKSGVQMLNQMATIITQPGVAIHILEFLASLSRVQNVYVNFREDEYKTIFAICFRYLDYTRDRQRSNRNSQTSDHTPTATVGSQSPFDSGPPSASDDLPQYVYALAYHVLIFWFLALKLPDRAGYVGWISKRLFADSDIGGQFSDDYALTTLDFMQRVAYADVDESVEDDNFTETRFGQITKRRWLIGNSIVTVKQATVAGWAQIVKRQPSGISAYLVRESFRPPPPHQAQPYVDVSREGQTTTNNILPSHLLVQLLSPFPQSTESSRPILLPNDDATERALRVLDRHQVLDGHKIGVIYIGEGQSHELEILANVSGSVDYIEFLNGLGTLTKLQGATFNTQGLNRESKADGEYAVCWRDRVTEIVFHVTTQMPTNLDHDPQLALKKQHIGNDFVNIIFNDSGLPFEFDTFPSQFNYVYIVISPASPASFIASREQAHTANSGESSTQAFYKVQVMSKPGFPEISPASETKLVSLRALPVFVRLVALNASVFSHAWQSRQGSEHVGSWRSRLHEIRRLRDKHSHKGAPVPSNSPPPVASLGGSMPAAQQPQSQQAHQQSEASRPNSGVRDSLTNFRRTSMATLFSASEQASHRSSVASISAATTDTEPGTASGMDSVVDSVDFSRWA